MKINNVELELDLADVDVYEKYMEEATKMDEVLNKKLSQEEIRADYKKAANLMREKCDAIKCFFDSMFGEGTGDGVCGETTNVDKCFDAYNILVKDVRHQGDKMNKKLNQNPQNRAQRRTKK